MSIAEAIERVEARIARRRETSEQYARKLHERLEGVYETKLFEHGDTWAVRVLYPNDQTGTIWLTIRCVMYDDAPKWEWSRHLRAIADGDDIELVVSYLRELFAEPIPS